MRTTNNNSDDDDDEATPLIRNPPPPPPPPLPPSRSQSGQAVRPPPQPPNARASPRQNPRPTQQQRQQIAAPATPQQALPPLPPPNYPPPPSSPLAPPPPAICKEPWILKLRHPGRGILRIHVAEGMTAYLLSKCIIQATDSTDETVVGLFGYNNGVFVSLEHLLSCSETSPDDSQRLHKQLYSLYIPEPIPQAPWWHDWRVLMGTIVLVLAILYQQLPAILHMISAIPILIENLWNQLFYYVPFLYHSLVTKPLKDTYRYGPSFFGGWEGADLPTICARITYGDKDFWARNYRDCENMYLAKESAFLFVGRPLVFLILVLILVWILRQFLYFRALQHQQQDRYQDRDMVQTYRAIQVLFRQMNRMMRVTERGGDRRQRDDYHD